MDKNLKPRTQVLKGLEHMEKTKYNPVFTKLWFEWLNSNINETAFSLNALNLGNDIVAFPSQLGYGETECSVCTCVLTFICGIYFFLPAAAMCPW